VLAVGVALSPVPIIAVVLMLGTRRGAANGPAFLLGWIIGLAVVGGIILLVSSGAGASDQGAPADWVSWLKLILAAVLFGIAVGQWRSRPRAGGQADLPKWMHTIERFTPGRSVAIGFALAAINPKNLLLTVGAATTIAQSGISGSRQALSLAVFVVIASSARVSRSGSTSRCVSGRRSSWRSCRPGWRLTTRRSCPCSAC
jgi:threonine/homoserine/homoserine lactone efflux protein